MDWCITLVSITHKTLFVKRIRIKKEEKCSNGEQLSRELFSVGMIVMAVLYEPIR